MATLERRLRDVISIECSIDDEEITAESHLENDLGLDSLDREELQIAIEDEFGVQILSIGVRRPGDRGPDLGLSGKGDHALIRW